MGQGYVCQITVSAQLGGSLRWGLIWAACDRKRNRLRIMAPSTQPKTQPKLTVNLLKKLKLQDLWMSWELLWSPNLSLFQLMSLQRSSTSAQASEFDFYLEILIPQNLSGLPVCVSVLCANNPSQTCCHKMHFKYGNFCLLDTNLPVWSSLLLLGWLKLTWNNRLR